VPRVLLALSPAALGTAGLLVHLGDRLALDDFLDALEDAAADGQRESKRNGSDSSIHSPGVATLA
jgi:hypothetical protein